jgi:hypothetical protein
MNIFPTNLQYFITKKHFENNKEIIKLYTDPKYSNKQLRGYYYPKKLNNFRYRMKWFFENECPCDSETFASVAECGNIRLMKWLRSIGCPWGSTLLKENLN